MIEPVVGTVMTQSPVVVSSGVSFKQVACALLASDACVVVVVAGGRPVGVVTEYDVLANLEFHGGIDAVPLIGAVAARRRRRKACATTAGALMTSPVPTVETDTPISEAARRLANPGLPALCVVDGNQRLLGLLTRRDLVAIYRRADDEIAVDVRAAIALAPKRFSRSLADVAIRVDGGVVTLTGTLPYRSQVQDAVHAASRVAGVVAVRSQLGYDTDDLLTTGF
jgi:CBS domain-containing protein